MHHIGDGADFVNRIKHVDGFWGVRHANGDTFTLFGAKLLQSGGNFVNFFNHFFVSDFGIKISEGSVVRIFAGGLINCVVKAAFKIFYIFGQFVNVAIFGTFYFKVELT